MRGELIVRKDVRISIARSSDFEGCVVSVCTQLDNLSQGVAKRENLKMKIVNKYLADFLDLATSGACSVGKVIVTFENIGSQGETAQYSVPLFTVTKHGIIDVSVDSTVVPSSVNKLITVHFTGSETSMDVIAILDALGFIDEALYSKVISAVDGVKADSTHTSSFIINLEAVCLDEFN
jgi:hypothetical protein